MLFFDLVAGGGIWLLHCKVIQLSFFVCDFLLTFLLKLDIKKNFTDTCTNFLSLLSLAKEKE